MPNSEFRTPNPGLRIEAFGIRSSAFGILLFLLGGLSASAAPLSSLPTNRPADRATVFSTSHRYAVSGGPAAQGLEIAAWAEDVEARLARFLGITIPAGDPLPVQIVLHNDGESPRGRVVRSQSYDAGMLDQRLTMVNPRLTDQEDLLEGLCSLLLTRTLVARQPALARTNEPPRAPDWLAVGVAQNLFLEARQRNAETVNTLWKAGRVHSIREITGWEFMPDGRWDDKAEAGVFLDFLLPPNVASKRSALLLAQLETEGSIGTDFLVRHIFFSGSLTGAEKLRDLWMAQQQGGHVRISRASGDRSAEFIAMLEVRPGDYGIPESDKIPLVADMRDLARRGGEKWAQQVAAMLSVKMQTMAFGQPVEFQRVLAAYVGFLDAVSGGKRGVFGNRASASALNKLLAQAEGALIQFQAAQKQRDAFMDAAAAQPAPVPDAIRKYLDDLERRPAP